VSVLLLTGSVAALGAVGAQTTAEPESYVTIGNVTVSPQAPEPGERIRVTAEVRNSESSTGGAEIREVSLRGPSTSSYADDLGRLGPGDSIAVPFATTFEDSGEKRLTVVLRGFAADGGLIVIEKPVYVDVGEDGGASMSLSVATDADVAAGRPTPVNVTVANGHADAITGVRLDLDGDGSVENPDRVRGSIASGSEHTFRYDVTFDGTGTRTLTGAVSYATADGAMRTATDAVDVEVVEPVVRTDLTASGSANRTGGTEVRLRNVGNVELADVELTARADGDAVARRLLDDVAPGSSASATFDVGSSANGTVRYVATYTAAGADRTTSLRDRVAIAGEIRLTRVEVSRTGGGLTVQGETANVGSTDAESVLLRVASAEGVGPAPPSGEYFVGGIEASEFATFELTAEAPANASSVPVELSYIVDGERVTTTQRVELPSTDAAAAPGRGQSSGPNGGSDDPADGSGGGLPLPIVGVVGAVVLLALAGVAVYRWRSG
jgi:hypothetical protein